MSDGPVFYISVVCVIIYFLSPSISFYKFNKLADKNEEWKYLPGIQVFSMMINCMFWMVTALGNKNDEDPKMWIINLVGLIISLVFVFMYWISAFTGKFKEYFIYLFNICNIIFQIGWGIYYIRGENPDEFGVSKVCAVIFNVFMYLSLYQNVYFIWKTNDYTKLPIIEAITGTISTLLWIIYSLTEGKDKTHILIPNSISLGFLLIFIGYYAFIRFRKKEANGNEETLNAQFI